MGKILIKIFILILFYYVFLKIVVVIKSFKGLFILCFFYIDLVVMKEEMKLFIILINMINVE